MVQTNEEFIADLILTTIAKNAKNAFERNLMLTAFRILLQNYNIRSSFCLRCGASEKSIFCTNCRKILNEDVLLDRNDNLSADGKRAFTFARRALIEHNVDKWLTEQCEKVECASCGDDMTSNDCSFYCRLFCRKCDGALMHVLYSNSSNI